ncbi:hypothetical protein A8W25_17585 [Streptomyces sp. ERV7]|nr:hypothetical protein A8W25_17585 [Streptomyces sp. ERV7]
MDVDFTPEQQEIRRTLRTLLTKRCGPDEVKAAARTPAGYDRALWGQVAVEMGLPGLAVPEAYGGVGCGAGELALAAEETGRALRTCRYGPGCSRGRSVRRPGGRRWCSGPRTPRTRPASSVRYGSSGWRRGRGARTGTGTGTPTGFTLVNRRRRDRT